jgi:ribose transport system permease protein
MVLPVIVSIVNFRGEESNVIPLIVGVTLLVGTVVDELIRRRSRARR